MVDALDVRDVAIKPAPHPPSWDIVRCSGKGPRPLTRAIWCSTGPLAARTTSIVARTRSPELSLNVISPCGHGAGG